VCGHHRTLFLRWQQAEHLEGAAIEEEVELLAAEGKVLFVLFE
jgi:hypothetical protein